MLVIIITILKLILASNNCDDHSTTEIIKEQIISLVCRKARNKDFFTLESAPKDLCSYVTRRGSVGINDISIVICHVYKDCKIYHTYTNTADKLDVNSPNLLNIFNFLKSFDVERIFKD